MYEFYMTIAGARQGAFAGEVEGGPHAGALIGLAYEQAAFSPAAGGARRRGGISFQPVRFTRQWGAASPQFLEALATGEALTTAVFEFIRTDDDGVAAVFHRVRLHGARVVEHRPFIDLDAEPSALMPLPPLEEVALSFTGITVENVSHGITTTAGLVPKPAAAKRAQPKQAQPKQAQPKQAQPKRRAQPKAASAPKAKRPAGGRARR